MNCLLSSLAVKLNPAWVPTLVFHLSPRRNIFCEVNSKSGFKGVPESRSFTVRKTMLMADIISGRNAGVSVWGLNYSLTKRLQLCLGGLLPNPGSNNAAGVVFEINILGYDANH